MAEEKEKIKRIARRVAPEILESLDPKGRFYVAYCCGVVLITTEEAKLCRKCRKKPEGFWATVADLD